MTVRVEFARLMDQTVRNARGWHYSQFRPCGSTVTREQATRGTVWADCSAGYAILARLAGAPNPLHSGRFDGYGNTVSAYDHLPHIPMRDAGIGDCVIFGPGGSHHISVVRQPGSDPLLWTHGSEAAPYFVRFSTESTWQSKPATFCRLLPKTPPAAAGDDVPEVDSYWTWLRWHLGEGEFRGRARDPKLRPDVPEKIPAAWWARAKRFIAAREGQELSG